MVDKGFVVQVFIVSVASEYCALVVAMQTSMVNQHARGAQEDDLAQRVGLSRRIAPKYAMRERSAQVGRRQAPTVVLASLARQERTYVRNARPGDTIIGMPPSIA